MGHTVNSIVIKAPYELVFDISNKVERWTELFGHEYAKADVLEHKGNEITFRLTDEEGKAWVSKRWLYKDLKFAYAQRWDPLFPFKYMKIVWFYTETPDGIKMTWIQDFEMDQNFIKYTAEQIEGFINKHSQDNMKIFKKVIEAEAGSAK
jgi:aromatase